MTADLTLLFETSLHCTITQQKKGNENKHQSVHSEQ